LRGFSGVDDAPRCSTLDGVSPAHYSAFMGIMMGDSE